MAAVACALVACGSSRTPPRVDPAAVARTLRATATTIDCRSELMCALVAGGRLRCWGDDRARAEASTDAVFTELAVGDRHACALDAAGHVTCVGHTPPPPAGTFITVQAHGDETCGLRADLSITCWGSGTATPPYGQFRALELRDGRACATRTTGIRECFGLDDATVRGAGPVPVTRAPRDGLVAVADCGHGSCGLRADGTVVCSGGTYAGQTHAPSGTFTAVAAGRAHSCALAPDGTLTCWGANDRGQSTAPRGTFRSVAAGGDTTCALDRAGHLECWGVPLTTPAPDPGATFRTFAVTDQLACGVDVASSEARCFGTVAANGGDVPTAVTSVNFLLNGRPGAVAVAVRPEAVDVLDRSGGWHCYRLQRATSGEVTGTYWAGPPSLDCTPFVEGAPRGFSVGARHLCVIGDDGMLHCSGANGFGQSTPAPGRYRAVAAGDAHTCAVTSEGRVVCWGDYVGVAL